MDAMFLEIEGGNAHMHIGSVAIFDAGPLQKAEGGLDFERLLDFAAAQLHKNPRFREKLATIPGFDRPVWVDDQRFNLIYHMRQTALPQPGSVRQLKRLVGRILSQQLDRGKPLWEVWFVEGFEEDRFAVVSKLHHCMADGVSSGDLLNMLMGPDPDYVPRPAAEWTPRKPPSGRQMVVDEVVRRVTGPLTLLGRRGGARSLRPATPPRDSLAFVSDAVRGLWSAAEGGLKPASPTPLNVELGPHRRFDWTQLDLAEVKRVSRATGGKVNDVALAVVSGAVRRFLEQHEGGVEGIEFRAAVPVNVRTAAERGQLGNRVSSLAVTLPIDEPDPWKRLVRLVEATRELKRSGQSQAVDLVGRVADWLPLGLMARLSRLGTQSAVNMVVTNVPGPPIPVYMLGARMLAGYPVVPLMPGQGLGVALFSYDGGLFWGFNADWEALPDLHDFVEAVQSSFEELAKSAAARSA
jgi:WS/DGAT/MGAT family acyltransferase